MIDRSRASWHVRALALGGAAGWLAGPAFAAAAVAQPARIQPPAVAQQDAVSNPPAANPDSEGGGEIIVTARQRSETLATTPLSVTAVTPATLEATRAITIEDVAGAVPNVLIQPVSAGPSAAAISIRGIAFADIEKSFDPAVGVLVDGVFIGTNTGQLLDFFDIASLEVLRGPQGTLFGRNTIGGVVNIRRTRPTGEFGAKVELTYGNYGTFFAKGVLNAPIIKDKLAIKVFEQHTYSNGFYRNVTDGNRREPHDKADNFGAALLFTPFEGFNALLTVEKQTQSGETISNSLNSSNDYVCVFAPANECNRGRGKGLYKIFTQFATPTRYRSPAETLELNYTLNDDLKLTSITAWRKDHETFYQDFDGTSVPFYETIRQQYYRQFSQEVRLAGNVTKSIDFVTGLYYFNSYYRLHQTTFLGPALGGVTPIQNADQQSKSYAGYIDVNWAFAPRLRATFGGRFTRDEKRFDNTYVGAFDTSAKSHWQKFTPKASLDYRPTDDVMVYGSYSRGYRAGGFNGRASSIATSQTSYNPETVDSFEVGLKTQFLQHRGSFNIAAFTTKYNNKQEGIIRRTPPGSPNQDETIVGNGASATIRGIEADASIRLMRRINLSASVGFLKSHYDKFPTLDPLTLAPVDLSGLDLILNPKFTGSVTASYTLPTSFGDMMATVNYRHISKYFNSITPDPSNPNPAAPTLNSLIGQSPPLNQLDLSLSVEPKFGNVKTKVNGFVRNVLDHRQLSAATIVPGLFSSGFAREPRTYGIQVGFEF